ncbi:hypothetical protein LTR97_002018 [Elasticomyces elasticus]|uniref:Uncharacterized protein n=1 Tax=Elasticomyces elasticus TaxID=574655 RepID=A0AAN8A4J3_9PEZI|nr:hypothetical protein LTR97_002018 [Elasticomyces elasticus]
MSYFSISVDDARSMDGEIAIVTGGSSGIGLATVQLFLARGATVISADLQPPVVAIDSSSFSYFPLDVTSWTSLCKLFEQIYTAHGRIDIVYANAGIYSRTDLFDLKHNENDGTLQEPSKFTFQVNLFSVANQISLAAHHMVQQDPKGGNIILTASSTGYVRWEEADYASSKHGVIGLLRSTSMHAKSSALPIRINAVAPSWTRTGLVTLSEDDFQKLGVESQAPEEVARGVALLATDEERSGQCLYIRGGQAIELEEPMHAEMLKRFRLSGLGEEAERVKVMDVLMQKAVA